MAVLKEFECKDHGYFDAVVPGQSQEVACPVCCQNSPRVFLTAPRLKGDTTQSFNPHYDEQLGVHFNSAEEKKHYLKSTGREQYSGYASPRKSTNTSIICSKTQSNKIFGNKFPKRKQVFTNHLTPL